MIDSMIDFHIFAKCHCAVMLIVELQELLEKFEFFPLRCHVQLALETFKINRERREQSQKLKTKVSTVITQLPLCSTPINLLSIQVDNMDENIKTRL